MNLGECSTYGDTQLRGNLVISGLLKLPIGTSTITIDYPEAFIVTKTDTFNIKPH